MADTLDTGDLGIATGVPGGRDPAAMAELIRRYVGEPDRDRAGGLVTANPELRQPAVIALLTSRAARARANGRGALAARLDERIGLLAGTRHPRSVDLVARLANSHRELLGGAGPAAVPPVGLSRARRMIAELLEAGSGRYHADLVPVVWDMAASVADSLADCDRPTPRLFEATTSDLVFSTAQDWVEAAVTATRRAIDALPPGDDLKIARQVNNLSVRLARLWAMSGSIQALDQAVEAGARAVALTPAGSPDEPLRLGNQANRLAELYHVGRGRSLLDQAVEVARRAVQSVEADRPELVTLLDNLSVHLAEAHLAGGPRSLLDEAVDNSRRALALTPIDDPAYPSRLDALARRLLTSAQGEGDESPERLAEAVDVARHAVLITDGDTGPGRDRRTTLALALARAGMASNDSALLAEASRLAARSAAGPPESPDHAERLFQVGAVLAAPGPNEETQAGSIERSHERGTGWGLEPLQASAAAACLRASLSGLQPDEAKWRTRAGVLERHLTTIGHAWDDAAVRDEAAGLGRQLGVAAVAPDADPWATHDHLVAYRLDRYRQGRDPSDLTAATEAARRAVEAVPDGHHDRSRLFHRLAELLAIQFAADHQPVVLDEAITAAETAVGATPEGDPTLARRANDLALLLLHRHGLVPADDTLRQAAAAARTAVGASAPDSPSRHDYLDILANTLARLQLSTGDDDVLREAVGVARDAVVATRERGIGHGEVLAGRLGKLAARLTDLHRLDGSEELLVEAVDVSRSACEATPEASPQKLRRVTNLARRVGELASLRSDPAVFDEALALARSALDETPPDHQDLPDRVTLVADLEAARNGPPNRAGQAGTQTPKSRQ